MKSLLFAVLAAGSVVASGQVHAASSQDRDFDAYLSNLQTQASVRVADQSLDVGAGLRLKARVGPDGRLTALRVVQTSGSTDADQQAVRAFRGWRGPAFPPAFAAAEVQLNMAPANRILTANN